MCERDGLFYRKFSRRSFLGGSAGAAATIALPAHLAGLLAPSAARAAGTTIKATHGSGFCNMGIFLAKERGLKKAELQ